jgi:hypothetical protein
MLEIRYYACVFGYLCLATPLDKLECLVSGQLKPVVKVTICMTSNHCLLICEYGISAPLDLILGAAEVKYLGIGIISGAFHASSYWVSWPN